MFGQIRKITIEDTVFSFENLDIEFEIDSKDDISSDLAKIYIYNLSKSTLEKLKKGQALVVEAGYKDNSGIIFNGTIDDIKTELEGTDYKTTILATPSNNLFTNTIVNIQFNSGIKASEILKKLENNIPYKIKILDIPKDIVYQKGKVLSTRLNNAIKIICDDIGAISIFEKNMIIIKAPNKVYTSVLKFGSQNGLIYIKRNSEKDGKESFTLESILNPQLMLNQVIEVDSINYPGRYIIKQIKYLAKDINTFNIMCVLEKVK